ncbi:MAG: pentapeptide repeat-containing protein [Spirochaetota bacterium]
MKKLVLITVILILLPTICMAQEVVKAEEIIQKINNEEHIYYENVEIQGDLDLTTLKNKAKCVDGVRIYVNSHMTFVNCVFKGKIIGYYINEEDKDWKALTYQKDLRFHDCVFEKEINWRHSNFMTYFFLINCSVKADISFSGCCFYNKTDFRETIFKGNTKFNWAMFYQGVYFTDTVFEGIAYFKGTVSLGYLGLTEESFKDEYYFDNCFFIPMYSFNP